MPAKSKKQQRFMAAVANNPKFAKKVGVPQDVGEEFMKMKKYQKGGMSRRRVREGRGPSMEVRRQDVTVDPPTDDMPDYYSDGSSSNRRRRRPMPRPVMKSGGKVYKKGGKVRGCGMATKGVRKAKMVSMKGS